MGKAKFTSMTKIQNSRACNVTYEKRKRGLLKKAIELSQLCDQQIFMIIYDENKNRLVQYQSHDEMKLVSDEFNHSHHMMDI